MSNDIDGAGPDEALVRMPRKAHDCQDCARHKLLEDGLECMAGHKPRFYAPSDPYHEWYGWKRRCTDFVAA